MFQKLGFCPFPKPLQSISQYRTLQLLKVCDSVCPTAKLKHSPFSIFVFFFSSSVENLFMLIIVSVEEKLPEFSTKPKKYTIISFKCCHFYTPTIYLLFSESSLAATLNSLTLAYTMFPVEGDSQRYSSSCSICLYNVLL